MPAAVMMAGKGERETLRVVMARLGRFEGELEAIASAKGGVAVGRRDWLWAVIVACEADNQRSQPALKREASLGRLHVCPW